MRSPAKKHRASAVILVALTLAAASTLLTSCSQFRSKPETLSTAYGEGKAVWYDDGDLQVIKFDDGSLGFPKWDDEGNVINDGRLWSVRRPTGEILYYGDDGVTVVDTDISFEGAQMLDGSVTTKTDMASMGEGFTYTNGSTATEISGTVLGVYETAPITSGDPGRCYFTYFEFTLERSEDPGAVLVAAPLPDYVVNGEEMFRTELYGANKRKRFGICEDYLAPIIAGVWEPNGDDAVVGQTYHSAEWVYLEEGQSLDGVMLGYFDGRHVYYAPTFVDSPMTAPNSRRAS
jgi:hypothetical protein